jgi:hypothetical protein
MNDTSFPQLMPALKVGGTVGELQVGGLTTLTTGAVTNSFSDVEIAGRVSVNESAASSGSTGLQGGVFFGGIAGFANYSKNATALPARIENCVSLGAFTAEVIDHTVMENITNPENKALSGYKPGGIVGAIRCDMKEMYKQGYNQQDLRPRNCVWLAASSDATPGGLYAGNEEYFFSNFGKPSEMGLRYADSVPSMRLTSPVSALLSPVTVSAAAGDSVAVTASFYPEGTGVPAASSKWSISSNPAAAAGIESDDLSATITASSPGSANVSFDVTGLMGKTTPTSVGSKVFMTPAAADSSLAESMSELKVDGVSVSAGSRVFSAQKVNGAWNILVTSDIDVSRLGVSVSLNTGARVTRPDVSGAVDFSGGIVEFEVIAPDGLKKETFLVTVLQESPEPSEYPSSMAWMGLGRWRAALSVEAGGVIARIDIPLTGDDAISFINVMSSGSIEIEGIDIRGADGNPIPWPMEATPAEIDGCTLSVYVFSPSEEDFLAASIGGLKFELAEQPGRVYLQSFSFGVDKILESAVVTGDTLALGGEGGGDGSGGGGGGGGGCDTGLIGLFALAIFAAAKAAKYVHY